MGAGAAIHRYGRRIAGFTVAAALLSLTLLLANPVLAQTADPMTATVTVDATAESPAKAREMARVDGQRRALAAVAAALAAGGTPPKIPKLDDRAITDLVINFEVANERMSAVRYTAEYTFHFRPAETRRALGSPGTNPSPTAAGPDQPGKALVVLPLYQAEGDTRLWDEPNPWRDAWNQRPPTAGRQRFVLPLGDAADLASIDTDKARSGDAAALSAVARRNGADEVLVPQATLQGPSDKPTGLDLNVRRYRAGQLADTHSETLPAKPGETGEKLLARAVAVIGAGIGSGWKKDPGQRLDQEGSLAVVMPISGLEDWVKARDLLGGVALVKKVTLIALSQQEATIEIGYSGSIDQLKAGLASASFILAKSDAAWRLTRGGP